MQKKPKQAESFKEMPPCHFPLSLVQMKDKMVLRA